VKLINIREGTDTKKSGIVVRLEADTEENDNFRKVIYTTELTQLVLMSLLPEEDIGMETHKEGDQFIRIDKGEAVVSLNGTETQMKDGDAVVIPKGTEHNITNSSKTDPLKIYAVYTPPEHKAGTIDKEKPK